MKRIWTMLMLMSIAFGGYSQDWVEKMQDPTVNFYEVQEAFNAHWADKEYERGQGYKQYKRWEYMMEPRVYPHGERPEPAMVYKEYMKFNQRFNKSVNAKSTANWTALGPYGEPNGGNPGVGRVNAVAVDPSNSDVMYVGTPAGGLWKSTTGGTNWIPLTDALPTLGVSGIAIDPVDTDIIYIGTGDGDADDTYSVGVLKSTDGGLSFNPTGLNWQINDFRTVNKLMISPYDHNTLFAASDNGLWKTVDAGASWVQVISGDVWDIEFHPTNSDIVYATRTVFYRSDDGGDSFSLVTDGTPNAGNVSRLLCAVSPDEPDWVYLLAGNSSDYGYLGTYRSLNQGVSFDTRSNSPNIMGWSPDGSNSGGQTWYDMAIAVDPNNADRVIVGGINAWASNNGGASWILKAHWVYTGDDDTYVHADIHFLDYHENTLWCGSDGGVYRSFDNGDSWTDFSLGLVNTQFYRLGLSQTDPDKMMCGAQDNGTFFLNDGTWYKVCGGDGMECAINPEDSDEMYCSSQFGNIRRSNDGGDSFSNYVQDINETGAWVTPYAIDPNNTSTVYAGYESLWRKTGPGNPWTIINSSTSSTINQIEVAEQNSDVIYFSKGNSISRTTDGGDTWTFINAGTPTLSKTDLDARPEDAMEIYVTCSGYTAGQKIYRSFDGGDTWENISLNLPNIPCNTVICEAGSDGGLYVGMDVGVYYLDNTLTNWVPFSEGIPNVIISELEIQNSAGKLRAATYGRGLWETDLHEPSAVPPSVDFFASDQIICEGGTVEFTDVSINAAPGWAWTFPGGTPSTSEETEPVITYEEAGVYDVTLTMSNSAGSTSETKTMLVTVLPLVGEPTPFEEGFETFDFSTDDRWLLEDIDGDGLVWQVNTTVGSASNQCMWIDNFQNNDGNRDNLFSNTIDVSTAQGLLLTFDVAYAQRNEDNADRLKLFTSGNCGDSWQLNESISGSNDLQSAPMTSEPFIPSGAEEWQEFTVDNISPSVLTEQFKLRFEFQNNGGNHIYLDNINLSMVSSLMDLDIRNLDLSVYPNPATEQVTLTYSLLGDKEVNIVITDLLGKEVLTEAVGSKGFGEHTSTLDISTLVPGIYNVQMIIDGKVGAEKLVVQ